jgi:hypothetical protein
LPRHLSVVVPILKRVRASGATTGIGRFIGMLVIAWIPTTAEAIGEGTLRFSPTPFALLPGGFF